MPRVDASSGANTDPRGLQRDWASSAARRYRPQPMWRRGAGYFFLGLVAREIERSFRRPLDDERGQSSLVIYPILRLWRREQAQEYLPRWRPARIGCFGPPIRPRSIRRQNTRARRFLTATASRTKMLEFQRTARRRVRDLGEVPAAHGDDQSAVSCAKRALRALGPKDRRQAALRASGTGGCDGRASSCRREPPSPRRRPQEPFAASPTRRARLRLSPRRDGAARSDSGSKPGAALHPRPQAVRPAAAPPISCRINLADMQTEITPAGRPLCAGWSFLLRRGPRHRK